MPSNHLILCRSILLLPSIFPSIRIFSNESVLHIRWPKYWRPGLISFRTDWLDLAVQGFSPTPQFKSINFSALGFLYDPTLTCLHVYSRHVHTWSTEKTIALTRQTFVDKVMSLLFNMLSRLVTTHLPRSKHLNFMAAVTICSDFWSPQM